MERIELWADVTKSFKREKGGKGDFIAFDEQLEEVGKWPDGTPMHRVYPGRNDRVLKVVRKIMRGLTHHRDESQIIADERVIAAIIVKPVPSDVETVLEEVYRVPNVANCRACFFTAERSTNLHSVWAIKLLEVEFCGVILPVTTSP